MVTLNERLVNYRRYFKESIQYRKIRLFAEENKKSNRFSDLSKHLIISGEPRGGTTWLMELLSNPTRCIILEPLHHVWLRQYNLLDELGPMPYIPENASWDKAKMFFEELFKCDLPMAMIVNFHYGLKNFKNIDSLLFKFCRANMLLPWLTKEFPEIKPMYLIRHPLSVISSRIRFSRFNEIGPHDNIFLMKQSKYTDILEKHEESINSIRSKESMYANWWAIQNILPLSHPSKRWLTVAYENLFLHPEIELKRISDYTGIETSNISEHHLQKPSLSTVSGSGLLTGENQLLNFEKYLTSYQQEEIMDIITNNYGINCYGYGPEPDYKILGYDELTAKD